MLYILTEGTYASNECIAFEDVQFSLVRSANRMADCVAGPCLKGSSS